MQIFTIELFINFIQFCMYPFHWDVRSTMQVHTHKMNPVE